MDNTNTMKDIDKRLTVVEATMATKADLAGLETRLKKSHRQRAVGAGKVVAPINRLVG